MERTIGEYFSGNGGDEDKPGNGGFSVIRPRRYAHTGNRRTQWAIEVIRLWKQNLAHRTRYPYPLEASFVQSRGGKVDDSPEANRRRVEARTANRLRKVREGGSVAANAKGLDVPRNPLPHRTRRGFHRRGDWKSKRYHPSL